MNSATSVHPSPWYYLLVVPFFVVGAGFFAYTLLHGFLHLTDSLTQVVIPGEAEPWAGGSVGRGRWRGRENL
jgi:hypothetical protein